MHFSFSFLISRLRYVALAAETGSRAVCSSAADNLIACLILTWYFGRRPHCRKYRNSIRYAYAGCTLHGGGEQASRLLSYWNRDSILMATNDVITWRWNAPVAPPCDYKRTAKRAVLSLHETVAHMVLRFSTVVVCVYPWTDKTTGVQH